MTKRLLALTLLPAALVAWPAQAVTTFQTNFDSIAVPAGGFIIIPTAEGWTATAGAGIEIQNHAAGQPFSETNLVELDSNNNSAMSRQIDAGTYTLDFYYSARPGIPASSNGIDVLINGVSIFNITGDGGNATNWMPQSIHFGVNATSTLTFAAIGTSDSLGGYLDNIALAGVPEPATWAMMLAGFGLLGAAARRRTRAPVTYA
ncbi:MAG: FxDxF family PEP-CTERM protein [Proteobacteria bacterium]|nr:FxDxF family PEP-CTERM protein [Pseudomonadota bacterium]